MAEKRHIKMPGKTGWMVSGAILLALTVALMFAEQVFASSGIKEVISASLIL